MSLGSDSEFTRFENFTHKYLNRVASRILNAKALSLDFGTESIFYRKQIKEFKVVVDRAMTERTVYAELIKNVWQNFVAYLGASDYGAFSEETYVNEFYLVTVANPFCVKCYEEGHITMATVVDHIVPHRGDQKLFWDRGNWQPLCEHHHNVKTMTEDRYVEYKF